MLVTAQQLLLILPNAGTHAGVFAPVLNTAMTRFRIVGAKRLAMFIAQVGHESGQLVYSRELWGPTETQIRYEGRESLGNTVPGDGFKFRGRGLIQITGRSNYRQCSLGLFGDERLLTSPQLLEQPQWAAESAGWFWDRNGLNELADRDQFNSITRRINGGLNGLQDRLQLWARARAVLSGPSV
ncbi:glycoside hydrolase family 19 protein [Pseudomonas vancouverensis]|uniref:glycoside hydrolase family 19 protein n=1 Tax=Pseudomonas vancouverensis TaxID=95300 RepID=UPI003D0797E8